MHFDIAELKQNPDGRYVIQLFIRQERGQEMILVGSIACWKEGLESLRRAINAAA